MKNENLNPELLIVVPNSVELHLYLQLAQEKSINTHTATTFSAFLKTIPPDSERPPYKVVVFSVDLSINDQSAFLETRKILEHSIWIVITDFSHMNQTIEVLKKGVSQYLRTPVNLEELHLLINYSIDQFHQTERQIIPPLTNTIPLPINLDSFLFNMSKLTNSAPFAYNLLSELQKYLPYDAGFIVNTSTLKTKIQTCMDMTDAFGLSFSQGNQITEVLQLYRETILNYNLIKFGNSSNDELAPLAKQIGNYLCVPLIYEEHSLAILFLFGDKLNSLEKWSKDQLEKLWYQVSLVYSVFYQIADAKKLAFVDELTGVYNMRYLDFALELEIKRANRYNHSVSILFIDLDHFKKVNDVYGHLVGSQLLIAFADVLRICLRTVDTIIRYGGDEYIAILPETTAESAYQVAQRIRAQLKQHQFNIDGHSLFLTMCIGIATYPQHAKTKKEILIAADKAMYQGKTDKDSIYIA